MSLLNFSGENVKEFTITGFDHLPHRKVLGAIILITYILILVGCGTNICIIATDVRLHQPMYLLICNLNTADIMFTTSASVTMISILLAGEKTISYYSCMSQVFIYHLGDITICLALSLMALDRTLAISYPLSYSSICTIPRVVALIILSWLIGFGCMGKVLSIADSLPYCQHIIRYMFCEYPAVVRASCVNPEPHFLIAVILGLWLLAGQLPLVVVSYTKIIYTTLRLPQNENRARAFKTVLSHLLPVTAYFTPKVVSVLLTRVGVRLNLTERNALIIVSTLVPSLINPIVYCLQNKAIRTRWREILTKISITPVFK